MQSKSRLRDGTEPAIFVQKLLSNLTYPHCAGGTKQTTGQAPFIYWNVTTILLLSYFVNDDGANSASSAISWPMKKLVLCSDVTLLQLPRLELLPRRDKRSSVDQDTDLCHALYSYHMSLTCHEHTVTWHVCKLKTLCFWFKRMNNNQASLTNLTKLLRHQTVL